MTISMFIKRMGRNTLPTTFDEVVKVEKEILSLKINPRVEELYDYIYLEYKKEIQNIYQNIGER
jgi:hypothetical protein